MSMAAILGAILDANLDLRFFPSLISFENSFIGFVDLQNIEIDTKITNVGQLLHILWTFKPTAAILDAILEIGPFR